jgi:endonuclease YncB( thermonuclease family)
MKNNRIVPGLALLAFLSFGLGGCQQTPASSMNSSLPSSTVSSSSVSSSSSSSASSSLIPDVDVVSETHMKLDASLFTEVMSNKTSRDYQSNLADFQRDGIERMLTVEDYAPNKTSDVFINYVDGDTTHFTTYNGLYTVKVRYLGVDTPESTSEIEEWGKSASLFNQSKLKVAKHIIVQSAGCAKTGEVAPADIDGYQRSLAYVWYTDVATPALTDFRNLNLELVYEGYSLFSGSQSDMDSGFYNAFVQANDIARAYKKAMFSGTIDPHYYYGAPKALGLDTLYDKSYYTNSDEHGVAYSMYCDEYTKWTFEGVVTRKVGTSFYIQDTINGHYYGLYVFTLRSYEPIKVGNRIKVSGVLSIYGGSYELTGISYSRFSSQPGDIEYVTDANGNRVTEAVTPIEVTPAQIATGNYECIFVKLKNASAGGDNALYFNTSISGTGATASSYSYGGTSEVNGYNATYPFYNTDNSMVVFGKFGSDMTGNISDFSTLIGDSNYIRIKVPQDIRVVDPLDPNKAVITSYQYFTGGTNYYLSGDAATALALSQGTKKISDLTDAQKAALYTTTYQRKKIGTVIGICQNYISTSGKNQKYSINVASAEGDLADFAEVD